MADLSPDIFHKIHRIQLHTTQLVEELLAGVYRSVFRGQGMEFEEVREYQPGDDIRSIDWNVTARMQHPYIKTFREERELSVFLLVDVSASTLFGTEERQKKELLAEVAAVIAFSAIKNNDRVGLILFSDRIEKYLMPHKGTRHVLRVIRELLTFQPHSPLTDLAAPLAFIGKVQPRRTICFILSDFMGKLPLDQLRIISKKHDLIAVHVSDPAESAFPKIGLAALTDLESKQRAMIDTSLSGLQTQLKQKFTEREAQVKQSLTKLGVDFVELSTASAYVPLLRQFFQRRKRRVR